MELKFGLQQKPTPLKYVLIVPLWNRNFSMQTIAYQFVYQILIVLLWN